MAIDNVSDKIRKIERTIPYPTLLRNTLFGLRSGERGIATSYAYFIKGLARELHIAPSFFLRWYKGIFKREFEKTWLKESQEGLYYDFKGAKVPYEKNYPLGGIFHDTFYFHCLFNDEYDSGLIRTLDVYLNEGAYGYKNKEMNVQIEKGDIVIDAGAWIGDFSALAAAKGAKAYAFEPTSETFSVLQKTVRLNGTDAIIPVKKGLSNVNGRLYLNFHPTNSEANFISLSQSENSEEIETVTLDSFVEENCLERVDFIKADIEGAEREMLQGAKNTLKKFTPKLALCTYHRPDDPQVLEKLILEANPNYRVVHFRKKLVAQVLP